VKKALLLIALISVVMLYGCQQQGKQEESQKPEETATQPAKEGTEPAKGMEGQPTEPAKEGTEPAKEGVEPSQGEQSQAIDGAQLFKAKTCDTCHQPNTDTAGPSLQKIAQIYKEQNANLVAFLKGEAPSIVDPSKADMMKPLLAHVKSLSEEEIKALANYILQ
jgi:cytochrome c